MSTAERIEDMVKATKDLKSADEFVKLYPFPFLVREATRRGKPSGEAKKDRTTTRVDKASAPMGDGFIDGDVWIFRVCPKDPERNEGAVTLGRAEDCDVAIDDETISQLHAKFTLQVGEPDEDDEDDDGRTFYVTDTGSSNGTWVDGKALAKDVPAALSDGVSVRFGPQAKFQFFKARGFFDFLAMFRRIKRPGR